MPRLWRQLALGLVLAWSLVALLSEIHGALDAWDHRASNRAMAGRWHFGSAQQDELRACLEVVAPQLPPGGSVVFVSPAGPNNAEVFGWRWASYLMPDRDVVPLSAPQAQLATWLIAFRRPIEHPRLEPLAAWGPDCRLYRVRPGVRPPE
jgi:hypothetical protein